MSEPCEVNTIVFDDVTFDALVRYVEERKLWALNKEETPFCEFTNCGKCATCRVTIYGEEPLNKEETNP